MEKSQIEKLRERLVKELSYEFMVEMTRNEYFEFAKGIFKWLEPYKNGRLTKDDIFNIIDPDIYHGQYEEMDLDEIFGIRLEILLNELIGYCEKPSFWDEDLEHYIKKWNVYYNRSYIL